MEVQQYTDRRLCNRKPISFDVALYYDGLGIVRCRTENMSLHGMFLKTGAIGLPYGATVDLALFAGKGISGKQYRVPADIVRVDDDGAALEFHELSLGSYSVIYKLLFPN